MDSKTVLDHALFQLTPTRTRCDLVIFGGKESEKIASGLLEPFVSHLKSARDQISKGGYSITLRPSSSPYHCSWFTKATLERFVGFVSTPQVLERFVTIEREIKQIESSIESNDETNGTVEVQATASTSDGDPKTPVGPPKHKIHQSSDTDAEKDHKIRLHHVLESRKTMLKKEQAMAHARALVAGFEIDVLYDLVSFADAFGAHRLREACVNFMELCNKKNEDKIWMDEVAAMRASYLRTSGNVFSAENNDLSQTDSDSITRHASTDMNEGTENGVPVEFNQLRQQLQGASQLATWPHQFPQYMQNTQASLFQPYPGYIYPGMQPGPSHYPGNMPWPANFPDPRTSMLPDSSWRHMSHKTKETHENTKNDETVKSDHSGSERSSSRNKRINTKEHSKNSSSKKVVIRNINYIASGSRNESDSYSSDEDEYVSEETLIKEQVEAAIGSLRRQRMPNSNKSKKGRNKSAEKEGALDSEEEKKDGSWDVFQKLLMRDSDSNPTDVGSKSEDVFQVDGKENASALYTRDDFLLTERSTGNKKNEDSIFQGGEIFHGIDKRTSKDEEFLISPRTAGEYYPENARFIGTKAPVMRTRKDDDWIIKSDIHQNVGGVISMGHNMFSGDQAMANPNIPTGENKSDVPLDDSFMVQPRTSAGPQTQSKDDIFLVTDMVGGDQSRNNVPGNSEATHNHFCEPEDLKMMLGHDSTDDRAVSTWRDEMQYENDVLLVETIGNRTKDEPSEPNVKESKNGAGKETGRKLVGKESKSRVPSGSLGRTKSDILPRNRLSSASNTISRSKSLTEEEKRKRMEELLLQRQKRISERSASKGVSVKPAETSKRAPKESRKNNSVSSSKTSVSVKPAETSKRAPKESRKNNSVSSSKTKPPTPAVENKKMHKTVLAAARTMNKQSPDGAKASQNKKPTPKIKNSLKSTKEPKKGTSDVLKRDEKGTELSIPQNSEQVPAKNGITEDIGDMKILHTVALVEKTEENAVSIKDDSLDKNNSDRVELIMPQMDQSDSKQSVSNTGERKKLTFSPEISIVNISTTPPENDEMIHSRKKWNDGESSPKIPKGFRRLLLFGRKT